MSTMDLERIPQGSVDNMPNELLQPNLEAREDHSPLLLTHETMSAVRK